MWSGFAVQVALVLAFAILAVASAQAGLIKQPARGQALKGDRLLVVVAAGPEQEDLRARLNGVSIGRRFRVRDGERRRVLDVSPVDGLRRGKNVLRVWVLRGGGYRRAVVHFKVTHRRPMAGAGIDRRVAVGTRVELNGVLRLDKSDSGPKRLRWQVTKAPARSALSQAVGSGARSKAMKSAIGGRRTLTPTFRPDVRGRYKVRLTATSGNGTSDDTATVYAVPPNPLIVLKTGVPASAQDPQPGIQVGGETLRAPYLRTAGGSGSYSGAVGGVAYAAMFQLVAYDRVTMAPKWNRTYGFCRSQANGSYPCMVGPDGNPEAASLSQELTALGPETLVIAASHPSGATPALRWGAPYEGGFLSQLAAIGIPNELDGLVSEAKAGEMAGVGVPGLAAGDAKLSIAAGLDGLDGYLTPDGNAPRHYFFVPAQRLPFDTRFARSCNAAGCTVAQEVGGTEVNGTIGAGQAGFLVSVYEPQTLAPLGHETFVTASGSNEGTAGAGARATAAFAEYIESESRNDRVVVVTSIHGPSQSQPVLYTPGTSPQTWEQLLQAVTFVGGTRDRFNRAATTEGSDYSLISLAPAAGEGSAEETSGAAARLQGALVPNGHDAFELQGVTSGEAAPAEMLMRILLEPPKPNAWPLEGNAEAQVAIAAIGSQSTQLGSDPRAAYWTQLTSAELAATALKEVESSTRPVGAGYSAAAFAAAKQELETEIGLVRQTRVYMKELAQPANSAGKVGWQEAGLIAAELEERLKNLDSEGQAKAEWLSVVEEILEVVSLGADAGGAEKLAKFISGAAIAAESGQTAWSSNYEGAAKPPGVTVKALQLGKQLRVQAEANEAAIARMGDVIVSDWEKLKIVGRYGGCNPNGGCGSYEELGFDGESEAVASAATKRAADRELYEQLVPLAYPIWNTGLAYFPSGQVPPSEFECNDVSYPFEGSPPFASYASLWKFNPESAVKTWRTYLSVARSERTYGWLSEPLLKRMFEPIPPNNTEAESNGLGIDRDQFMRQGLKINEYTTDWYCDWQSDSAEGEEGVGLGPTYTVARGRAN